MTDQWNISEAQHLADALQGLFSHSDNAWITPFTDAISGLSAAQAAAPPGSGLNSIWALVNHVRFWQEATLLRLRGQKVDRKTLGAENGWPPSGAPSDEDGWEAACARAITVNAELAELVAELSDEEIAQPVEPGRACRWQILHGLIAHNSYHICAIVAARRMLGLWTEQTYQH